MKYPKYHGKDFDVLRKRQFNDLRKTLEWVMRASTDTLSKEEVQMMAWNCAYTLVTKE